jgi:N-acetylglucosamine-6-phosphate deacetylase
MAEAHARGGTTSLLPTTLTSSDDELRATLKAYRSAVQKAAAARPGQRTTCNLIGVHLEGQYFAPTQAGAQDPRYLKSPVPGDYLPLLDEFPEIRRWSAAPELPGALEFGSVLRSRGVLASIAHTDTDYNTVVRALESGFTHLTHFYLGMSTIRRVNCFRVPGVIEAGYLMDELTIELLADGFHIPTTLLRLAHKIKGADHVALVTDGNRAVGMPDGEYLLGSLADGQPFIKEDGGRWMRGRTAFAAGVVTFNVLVKTIVEGAGIPLPDACRMASTTPARILGLADKGVLAPGRDADLVVLEPDFEVALTMAGGQVVYRKSAL